MWRLGIICVFAPIRKFVGVYIVIPTSRLRGV